MKAFMGGLGFYLRILFLSSSFYSSVMSEKLFFKSRLSKSTVFYFWAFSLENLSTCFFWGGLIGTEVKFEVEIYFLLFLCSSIAAAIVLKQISSRLMMVSNCINKYLPKVRSPSSLAPYVVRSIKLYRR